MRTLLRKKENSINKYAETTRFSSNCLRHQDYGHPCVKVTELEVTIAPATSPHKRVTFAYVPGATGTNTRSW